MEPPGTTEKKLKISLLSLAKKNKSSLLYPINYLNIVKKTTILLSDPAVTFYVLYSNFFYTRLAFVFDLQKDF